MILVIFDSVNLKSLVLNLLQFIRIGKRFTFRAEKNFGPAIFLMKMLLYLYNLRFSKENFFKGDVIYIRNSVVINKDIFLNHSCTNSTIILYGDSIIQTKRSQWYEARPSWSKTLYEQIDYLGDIIIVCNIDFRLIDDNFLKFINDETHNLEVQRIEHSLGIRYSKKVNNHRVPQLQDSKNVFHRESRQHTNIASRGKNNFSICIPTAFNKKGEDPVLLSCLESLDKIKDKGNFEVVLCFHEKDFFEFQIFKNIHLKESAINFRFYQYPYQFNFSKVMNDAIEIATNDNILLLNDDVEIEDAAKLFLPFEHFNDSTVGAVGINLFFGDGTFQHAGIEYRNGEPQHFLKGSQRDFLNPWTSLCREVSGVTGAVLYLKKDAFRGIGKFDESFPLDYGDVDLMLRLRNSGYQVLICSAVSGVHPESSTRSVTSIVELEKQLNLLEQKNQKLPTRDSFLITCADRTWK
jgi:hypothetical protein